MPTQSDPQASPTLRQMPSEVTPKARKPHQLRDMTVAKAVRLLSIPLKHPTILPTYQRAFVEEVIRGATDETIRKALQKLGADQAAKMPKTKYTRRVLERVEHQAVPKGLSRGPRSRKAPKKPKALSRARKQRKETP